MTSVAASHARLVRLQRFRDDIQGALHRVVRVTGIGLIVDYSALHAYNALLVCDKSEAPRMVMFEAQTDRVLEYPNGMHRDASGYLHFYLFIYPTDSFEDVALFYQYHYTDDTIVLERYDNELALRVTT